MEINPSLIRDYPAALDRAVRLLAERPRSKKEIRDRLSSAGYDEEVVDLVILKLEKEKLLDDQDFAEQWVQSRSRKYGPARIRHELRIKGIDQETVQAATESMTEQDQLEHAMDAARRKIRFQGNSCDPRKLKQRIIAMLVRKGYSWELASKAYDAAMSQDE